LSLHKKKHGRVLPQKQSAYMLRFKVYYFLKTNFFVKSVQKSLVAFIAEIYKA
jgi:hypothetical protein